MVRTARRARDSLSFLSAPLIFFVPFPTPLASLSRIIISFPNLSYPFTTQPRPTRRIPLPSRSFLSLLSLSPHPLLGVYASPLPPFLWAVVC